MTKQYLFSDTNNGLQTLTGLIFKEIIPVSSISVKSLTQNGLKQPPNGQMPVWTLEMTGTWWKMTTKTFF
jgi:hypothetical protein